MIQNDTIYYKCNKKNNIQIKLHHIFFIKHIHNCTTFTNTDIHRSAIKPLLL
jgi:hypothetical protein